MWRPCSFVCDIVSRTKLSDFHEILYGNYFKKFLCKRVFRLRRRIVGYS